jgi:hypothetical protein
VDGGGGEGTEGSHSGRECPGDGGDPRLRGSGWRQRGGHGGSLLASPTVEGSGRRRRVSPGEPRRAPRWRGVGLVGGPLPASPDDPQV